jgi:MFS family permease
MAQAGDGDWPSAGRAWATVGVLLVAYVFSFLDRQILALLVGPVKADLNLSDTEFSLLSGFAFALFYTVLGLPFGRLADRYSRRRIIAVGAFLWSLATVACGFAKSFAALFVARVMVGVGEASLGPSAFSMLADLFPRDKAARAFSVFSLGIYIGSGLAFALGGLVVGAVTATPTVTLPVIGETASWHAAFIAVGAPGLLLPLLLYALPEPVRRGRTAAPGEGPGIRATLAHVWARKGLFLPFFIGFGVMVLAGFAILAWTAEFFQRVHGLDPRTAGGTIGVTMILAGSVGVLAGGWFTDWLTKRGRKDAVLVAGIGAALVGAVPSALFPIVSNVDLAMALLAPAVFFGAFVSGAAPSALAPIVGNEMRGQVSALYLLAINLIGIGLGPTIPALFTDFVFMDESKLGWSLAAVGLITGPVAALLLNSARKRYVEAVSAA